MEPSVRERLSRGKTFIAGGICSGLANYYGLRKGGVQTAFIVTSLFLTFPVLIYLILWLILPKNL